MEEKNDQAKSSSLRWPRGSKVSPEALERMANDHFFLGLRSNPRQVKSCGLELGSHRLYESNHPGGRSRLCG
jgi:hypothetical protein